MTISNNENKSESIIMVLILLSIILLYPDSAKGFIIYVPQFIIGFTVLVSLLKFPITRPGKSFLVYALYMTIMNLILSIMNQNANVFEIFISSIRLYYPFLGLMIGITFRKKIKPKSLLKILLFFLILESVIVFLQINNLSFRVWSYNLYRPTIVDYYLNAFAWETGRRAIGTIGNPNLLGMLVILLYTSVLFLSNLIIKKGTRKLVNIASIIMSLYICISTQSRTAILLWCFVTIFIMYWKFPRRNMEKIFYLYLLIFVVIILIFYFQAKISREISLSALDSRINIWKSQISRMFDYTKYEDFFASVLGIGFKTARDFGTFDNTYVKVFVSGGLIGLIIYLKTIIDTLKAFLIREPRDIWKGLGLSVIFIWILGSIVAEYQEAFKLSIMTFIILGYALNSNEKSI